MSEISSSSLNGKKATEEASMHELMLIIKSQDDREHRFMVTGEKKLSRLFAAYCRKTNVEYGAVDFIYDGNRLSSTKTPLELGLEHGDIIDAVVRQSGGGFSM